MLNNLKNATKQYFLSKTCQTISLLTTCFVTSGVKKLFGNLSLKKHAFKHDISVFKKNLQKNTSCYGRKKTKAFVQNLNVSLRKKKKNTKSLFLL